MKLIKQSKTKREEQKYEQAVKMVKEAHKEVLDFVKKNINNDPRLRIRCSSI